MSTCPDCRYNPCQCDTLDSLRTRVEELESEIEILKRREGQLDRDVIGFRTEVENLKAEVARLKGGIAEFIEDGIDQQHPEECEKKLIRLLQER